MRKNAAAAAALGLAAALVGPAASAHPSSDPYPESEGYQQVDDTFTLPAGGACNRPVIVHFTGYQRSVLNGQVVPVGTDLDLQAGDTLITTYPEQRITVTNKRDPSRSVTRATDGPSREHVRKNGVDEDVSAIGANVFFDVGVKGIVVTQGYVRFVIKDFAGDNRRLRIKPPAPTSAEELCTQVGLRPVFPSSPS
jgi:hypothetical protein